MEQVRAPCPRRIVGAAGSEVLELLGPPARPGDDHAIDAIAAADAERHRQLRLRQVARSALDHPRLRRRRRGRSGRSRRWRRGWTSCRSAGTAGCGCPPVWSLRSSTAGPLLVVISRSTSPSRSKSPHARPRPTRGCANPAPATAARRRGTRRCPGSGTAAAAARSRRCRGCCGRCRRCGRWRRRDRAGRRDRGRRRRSRTRAWLRDGRPTPAAVATSW